MTGKIILDEAVFRARLLHLGFRDTRQAVNFVFTRINHSSHKDHFFFHFRDLQSRVAAPA